MSAVESFRLALGLAAPVEQLEAWMESAPVGDRVIYASGFDLPRDAAGVQLVKGWIAARKVLPLPQRRDQASGRTEWMVQKMAACADHTQKEACAADRRSLREAERLLEHLRHLAQRGRACPSNSQLARELELGGSHRGRARAQYLLQILERQGRVQVQSHGRNAARVVTITTGAAQGKSTAPQVYREVRHG